MEFEKAIEFLRTRDNFLLSSHVNPDGDGVGSILGMLGLLQKLGKNYTVITEDKPQEKLSFLQRFDEFTPYNHEMKGKLSFSSAIIIDSPHLERIGTPAQLLAKDAQILNIDHHVSSERFGTVNLIIPSAAASAQVVAGLFDRLKIAIDQDSADALYVGLSVDTGRFRFNNTTAEVFRLAARLVEAGVQPDLIADELYYQTSMANKTGLAKVLESIELHFDGKVATSFLGHEFLNSPDGKDVDTEGFVNQPMSIEGVLVAVLIRENEKGKTRVSLRSRNDIDVNAIAGQFGGGGHVRASGCRMEGSIQEVKAKLLAAIGPHVK
ncbi:MAG: bifunctional oligoribonuclease/PAP phosphatase NrnA [Nitrospinae bacterium]|nr:bifunctional oligoribonuclease/PAP phosphatase NrnA [Nitrospinota bacterium]